jgi:hypothetical protein
MQIEHEHSLQGTSVIWLLSSTIVAHCTQMGILETKLEASRLDFPSSHEASSAEKGTNRERLVRVDILSWDAPCFSGE